MTRPRFFLWLRAALSCLILSAEPPSSWAQRRTPITKPGDAIRAPYQSPAARLSPRVTPPPPLPRPDTVPLPFSLMWGDSQQRLSSLFAGVGASIIDKKTVGQSETWTVNGLIAPGLQASLFTFQQGILSALEFDYGQSDWDTDKYNEIMGQLRRRLEGICGGPGEMISRQTTEQPADANIKQTLMGYQWTRGDSLVQLFYFSAEQTDKALTYRTISVHYHYQDPSPPPATGNASDVPAAGAATAGPQVSVPADIAKQSPAPPRLPVDSDALPEK